MDDATAEDAWRVASAPPEGLMDGTKNFLALPLLKFGVRQVQQLGGMEVCAAPCLRCCRWWQCSHHGGLWTCLPALAAAAAAP